MQKSSLSLADLGSAVKEGKLKLAPVVAKPAKPKKKKPVVVKPVMLTPSDILGMTRDELLDIAVNRASAIGPVLIRNKEDREAYTELKLVGKFRCGIIKQNGKANYAVLLGGDKRSWNKIREGHLKAWAVHGVVGDVANIIWTMKLNLKYDLIPHFAKVWFENIEVRNAFLNRPIKFESELAHAFWAKDNKVSLGLTPYEDEKLTEMVQLVEDGLSALRANAVK